MQNVAILLVVFFMVTTNGGAVSTGLLNADVQQTLLPRSLSNDCSSSKVSQCKRKCGWKRNDERRVDASCAIGDAYEVHRKKTSDCLQSCEDDDTCTYVETWTVRGNGKLHCQLYSCSTLSGDLWRSINKLRKFFSYSIDCPGREDGTVDGQDSGDEDEDDYTGEGTDEDTDADEDEDEDEDEDDLTNVDSCGLDAADEDTSSVWGSTASKNAVTSPVSAVAWKTSVNLAKIVVKGTELPPASNLGIDTSNSLHGRRPNLLLILADDLGIGDTGVDQFNGNYEKLNTISTPHLQKMANKGVVFTQAYSVNAVCLPSRYSMLVGRHAGHSRVRGNSGTSSDIPFTTDEVTLASVLQGTGYKTALIGKWGLGKKSEKSHPIQKGFDYFYGQLTHKDAHACFPVKMHNNSADASDNAGKYAKSELFPENKDASKSTCSGLESPLYASGDTPCSFVQDVFANKALEYMENHVSQYSDGSGGLTTPFFVYLSLTVPHICSWSHNPNDEQRKVAPYMDPDCLENLVWASNEGDSERGIDTEECRHKSLMENYIDRDIGRIMDLIDSYDELKNTLVVFVGDNGPERNANYVNDNSVYNRQNNFKVLHSIFTFGSTNGHRGIKRQLYEGSLLTPMIWYWKGVTSGHVSQTPTTTADIFSTFADVAGLTSSDLEVDGSAGITRPLDSISLVSSLSGNDDDQVLHRYLYFEYCDQQSDNWKSIKSDADSYCSWSLLIRNWKLIYDFESEEMELFDITNDPFEEDNLYVTANNANESTKTATLYQQQATMECVKAAEAYISLTDAGFSP
ncbi:Arylsulfatase [Hondaea fermentalgiana]|uniref:Arylsulfatase n=1 Tax=Hondaea fermentalgiana TaxID=2315210 RepID=A0A2R5G131_9STRA|nr:Arylsulfatase [Hondaea fermentalgiana]|eukprot:GBG24235.1 Arylsulfatase [Hondaea fermentalgiana]